MFLPGLWFPTGGPCFLRQSLGPHSDLLGGLFAGDIENPQALLNEIPGNLKQKCGLAHTRFSPEKNKRPGNDASSQNAVKLGVGGLNARRVFGRDFA